MSTSPTAAFCAAILALIVLQNSSAFKTQEDLKERLQKLENQQFSSSDVWVGKALDFINSNKTMMSLVARELWNVGSKAIDSIVEVKTKKEEQAKRGY